MGGTKGKNLKTPKSVKCPASISENPVPLCILSTLCTDLENKFGKYSREDTPM